MMKFQDPNSKFQTNTKHLSKFVKIFLIIIIIVTAGILAFTFKPQSIANFKLPGRTYKPKTTTLFFAGDIMLSRNVAAAMYKADDFTLPFQKVADKIKQTDIAFANLESPFNDHGDHSIDGSLVFNADPNSVVGLKAADFNILSTANNHAFDQGQTGIQYTLDTLKQNNILSVGTGLNCHTGQIIEKNQIKFGFLAYSYTALNDGGKTTDPLVCDANDLVALTKDIETMRPNVDYLVVSTHMGIEYTRNPSDAQTKFAHSAVDAGADLVIGNHPHWVQPVEQYQGKWIFYAMGNFVFDQMWSEDTREGLTATLTFTDKTLSNITLAPVILDDYCCPRWASNEETKIILNKINLQSPVLFQSSTLKK